MIHVQQLTKTYRVPKRASGLKETLRAMVCRETDTIGAVRDLTFTVQAGEMIGYIGPNGAGKSTTILTTHDMNDIEALTDRILLIGKGSLLYDGSLDDLRGKYEEANLEQLVVSLYRDHSL